MEKKKFFKPFTEAQDTVIGIRPMIETLKSGRDCEVVLIKEGLQSERLPELYALCNELQVPVQKVPEAKLNRVSRKNHQGVIGFVSIVKYVPLAEVVASLFERGEDPFILVLDRITDVRNFGAIVRTAECAGVHAVVVPEKGKARIGTDSLKTSAGAINLVPICREPSLKTSVNFLKESGLQIIACTEKTDKLLYEQDFTGPTAIVMGSEEDGVSPELLALADSRAAVPLVGKIGSLNVSVAAGIILFETIRQRKLAEKA